MTIDQEDLVWTAIRIFGLYFILMAIMRIPAVLASVGLLLYWAPEMPHLTVGASLSTKTALMLLSKDGLHFILYLTIGIYLLRRGEWVFKLIKLPTKHVHTEQAERELSIE